MFFRTNNRRHIMDCQSGNRSGGSEFIMMGSLINDECLSDYDRAKLNTHSNVSDLNNLSALIRRASGNGCACHHYRC